MPVKEIPNNGFKTVANGKGMIKMLFKNLFLSEYTQRVMWNRGRLDVLESRAPGRTQRRYYTEDAELTQRDREKF